MCLSLCLFPHEHGNAICSSLRLSIALWDLVLLHSCTDIVRLDSPLLAVLLERLREFEGPLCGTLGHQDLALVACILLDLAHIEAHRVTADPWYVDLVLVPGSHFSNICNLFPAQSDR